MAFSNNQLDFSKMSVTIKLAFGLAVKGQGPTVRAGRLPAISFFYLLFHSSGVLYARPKHSR